MSTSAVLDRAVPASGAAPHRASTALLALLGLQAWVWTASVLPKVTSTTFVSGFMRFVATARSRPALYGRLVGHAVLAAPSLFAWAAITVETSLALSFVVAVVAVVRHRGVLSRRIAVTSAVASVVAAGFALNLAMLVGDAAPWTLGDPFDSGVPVEHLLAGLALATAASLIWSSAGRRGGARGQRPAAPSSRSQGSPANQRATASSWAMP